MTQLGKYLGVPLIHERVRSQHFNYLIEKVHMRLSGWKGKLLSQAARLVLTQSVNVAIPSYVMQSCKLLMKMIQLLERANRRFLWGDTEHKLKLHPISWVTLCQPKQNGGLGIRTLECVNKVMLAKLAWRYLKEPNALWARVLTAMYGRVLRSKHVSLSFIRRGLLCGYTVLKQVIWRDADGSVEMEPWWLPSSKGKFTRKSAHKLLQTEPEPTMQHFEWRVIWNFRGPTRGSMLLWQLAHDRLKMKSLLWERQVCESARCDLCNAMCESSIHAIRDCQTTRNVWGVLLSRPSLEAFWTKMDVKAWILLNVHGGNSLQQANQHWKYSFSLSGMRCWRYGNVVIESCTRGLSRLTLEQYLG